MRDPRRSSFPSRCLLALALLSACGSTEDIPPEEVEAPTGLSGVVYEVGPGKAFATLGAVVGRLKPGDTVQVYPGAAPYAGGVAFTRPGTAQMPILIKGVRQGGVRPALVGGASTVEFGADHYVFDGFDLSGGTSQVVSHHAHGIIIRDTFIHDGPSHGVLSADANSGSLTLDYVEVARCGAGQYRHPIYVATDETAHPGAAFRMRHCYVHEGRGGNNVKTRAQRNEIYYNWIEGAFYRELELIGPDGQDPGLSREDSDVVGNVLVKTSTAPVVRIGGDGTGDTGGRYRFVNNTIVLAPQSSAAVQVFDRVQSLELHNNVFYRSGGGGVTVLSDRDATWVAGRAVLAGGGNWLPTGSTAPTELTGTLQGAQPGFAGPTVFDYLPLKQSPLVGVGVPAPQSPDGYPFPRPLPLPRSVPPARHLEPVGTAKAREDQAQIAIGAFPGL